MTGHKNILVIGANGVVGKHLIPTLCNWPNKPFNVFAATRKIHSTQSQYSKFPQLNVRFFDLTDHSTFKAAFDGIDSVFLIRPPTISAVKKHFKPLINHIQKVRIKQVILLSIYANPHNLLVPHFHIERLLKNSSIRHVNLRSTYFMQNLTTGFLHDICEKKQLFSPTGNAIFNWVDAKDCALLIAKLFISFPPSNKTVIDVIGPENYSFDEVAKLLSSRLDNKIKHTKVNVLSFIIKKIKQGLEPKRAIIMAVMHFVSRFRTPPMPNDAFESLTQKKPNSLAHFIAQEIEL